MRSGNEPPYFLTDEGADAIRTGPPTKESARCCRAKALPDGRPVLGFCGPECLRRPSVWAAMRAGER